VGTNAGPASSTILFFFPPCVAYVALVAQGHRIVTAGRAGSGGKAVGGEKQKKSRHRHPESAGHQASTLWTRTARSTLSRGAVPTLTALRRTAAATATTPRSLPQPRSCGDARPARTDDPSSRPSERLAIRDNDKEESRGRLRPRAARRPHWSLRQPEIETSRDRIHARPLLQRAREPSRSGLDKPAATIQRSHHHHLLHRTTSHLVPASPRAHPRPSTSGCASARRGGPLESNRRRSPTRTRARTRRTNPERPHPALRDLSPPRAPVVIGDDELLHIRHTTTRRSARARITRNRPRTTLRRDATTPTTTPPPRCGATGRRRRRRFGRSRTTSRRRPARAG
jgi:hypothetical protein